MALPSRLILVQLLPIVIFLAIDALVQDPRWAIASALAFVLFQALFLYLKERRFDRLILIDTLLIGGMGVASLLTNNEVFFKMKPVLLEGVMALFFLGLSLAKPTQIQTYFSRYTLGPKPPLDGMLLVKKLIRIMSFAIIVHAAFVLKAALSWSKATWGLISGPGFYAILIPFIPWLIYLRWKRSRQLRSEPTQTPSIPSRATSKEHTKATLDRISPRKRKMKQQP